MGAAPLPRPRPTIALLGGDGGPSGVPRHIGQLACALGDMAELVVISDADRGGYGFARGPGITHVEIPGLASSLRPGRVSRAGQALGRALTRHAPDIVWAHARLTVPLARLLARRVPGAALIVTYHGVPFGPGHRAAAAALSRQAERAFLRLMPPHHLVFLTPRDRDAFPPGLLARHPHRVIPNCSDLGGFSPPEGPAPAMKTVVMTTRDNRQKNLDAAARIFSALPADYRLVLAGMGTAHPGLRARFAHVMGAEALARVEFAGPVADVRPLLAAADCYLLSSRYEGLSIGMLEAFEYGLPVVTSDVGGARMVAAHHPFARVVDLAAPGGIAAAAAHVAEVTEAWRADRAGHAARIHAAWATAFTRARWQTRVQALVRDVLDQSCRSRAR